MANQAQYNTTVQRYRDISIKIELLDFNYYIIDEISGIVTSATFSINADSDIRRTCNVDMVLKDEYSQDFLAKDTYWKSGNPFWFDKYLKIYIGIKDILTDEIVWNNQGIYMINAPNLLYDAMTNSLSFDGVDLMAMFTGMRNGNLEGVGHEIPVGTNIRSAIIDILTEQGFNNFVINTPPQGTTPYEIKTSAGGASYNLLSELRDINPNYEMFFDVDGVFYFQEIASNNGNEDNITPLVNAETFKILNSRAELNTSFEDVKNYVEVYGKAIETTGVPISVTPDYDTRGILIKIDGEQHQVNSIYDYSFTLGDISDAPVMLNNPIVRLEVKAIRNGHEYGLIQLLSSPILYNNMSYNIRVITKNSISYTGYFNVQYLGYTQPFGLAWDDNEQSPFYVGDEITLYDYASPTDAVYDKPQFERQVRIVLSGGEYDNIYSNELAMQRAKYELYLRSALHDNIQITLVPIYWIDVNQIIEYQLPNEDKPSYWLVKSVATNFSVGGQQTITAIRYYFNQ